MCLLHLLIKSRLCSKWRCLGVSSCEWHKDGLHLLFFLSLRGRAEQQCPTPTVGYTNTHTHTDIDRTWGREEKPVPRQAQKRQNRRHNKTIRKKSSGPPVPVTNSAGRQTRWKKKRAQTSVFLSPLTLSSTEKKINQKKPFSFRPFGNLESFQRQTSNNNKKTQSVGLFSQGRSFFLCV